MAADIPGQILPVVDEKRLADPIWYEWFAYLWRFVRNSEGAWTAFTPTVRGTGVTNVVTFTNNGCRYRRVGRTVNVIFDIAITNLNGATGSPSATLPVSPGVSASALSGREINTTGHMIVGQILSPYTTAVFVKYDNTSPLVVGYRLLASGNYEV